MLDLLDRVTLSVMDFLLGWLLLVPRSLAIVMMALGTALLMLGIRKWVTNQDLLKRCAQDKKRLAALIKEARRRKDKEAIFRHRKIKGVVALKQLRAEGKPLLIVVLPIALLATWCFQRLEFYPVSLGESVTFAAYFPVSQAGEVAHMVPQPGLNVQDGWIKELVAMTNDGPAYAQATWRCSAEKQKVILVLRFHNQSYAHQLIAGERIYGPPILQHEPPLLRTELQLRPVKLCGVVPGVPTLGLASWLVGYLLVVIAAMPLLKRGMKVF